MRINVDNMVVLNNNTSTYHPHAGHLQYEPNFEAVSSTLVVMKPLFQPSSKTWIPNQASSSSRTPGDHPEQVKWKTHDEPIG